VSIIQPSPKKWMLALKVFGEITLCWVSILEATAGNSFSTSICLAGQTESVASGGMKII